MPFDIAKHFVDRGPERELFHRMLKGDIAQRIMLVLEGAEKGKSCFLLRLNYECEQSDPPAPVILLDFDQRRSGLTDYFSVACEVRNSLGDARTPNVCACEEAITRSCSLISVRTGDGDAGMGFGSRNRFDDAELSGMAGRDNFNMKMGDVTGGGPTPEQRAQQHFNMGRALRSDLAALPRVAVLIDTFEHAPDETCAWLGRWLLEPLRRELANVVLVVAGRPDDRPDRDDFFHRPRLWSNLIHRSNFKPLTDDDILTHYYNRGLRVTKEESPIVLDLVHAGGPASMTKIGDWLSSSRGGPR